MSSWNFGPGMNKQHFLSSLIQIYFSEFCGFWATLSKLYFFDISSFDFWSSIEHLWKLSKEILFLISTSWSRFRIRFVENFLHFSRIAKIKYGSFWDILKIWRWNRICGKPVFLSTWDYFLLIDVLFLRKHIFLWFLFTQFFQSTIKVLSIATKFFF